MAKQYQKAVFIFRRDLRLEDNSGLLAALAAAEVVVPVFVFDERQIDGKRNPYFSPASFHFMVSSLCELTAALEARGSTLRVCRGNPAEVVQSLIAKDGIDSVFANKDYTPFARLRDEAIATVCQRANVPFLRHEDVPLSPIETIRTGSGKPYTVFTPFMRKARTYEVSRPRKNNFANYFSAAKRLATPTIKLTSIKTNPLPHQTLHGGRAEGLHLLRDFEYLSKYQTRRNLPAVRGTSLLSAHHKFGTISIRETFHHAHGRTGAPQFITELYWRDFYYHIAYHFPTVFKRSFLPWATHLAWNNNKTHFASWCQGQTGVPLVDAGMRQLNATGWMHNRVRMVVASYLTKNLLINWRWGERYFAQTLVDYDPAQNNGGWQWSASTGADPRPLRIFNPYTQAAKYDSEATYIQQWVPELADVAPELLTDGKTRDFSQLAAGYPAPLVGQKESFHRAKAAYAKAKQKHQKKAKRGG